MVNTVKINKPTLRNGDVNAAVKELQELLVGYSEYIRSRAVLPGAIDGQFGPMTERAVKAFQEQVFLPRTGVVADLTWRSLFKRAPVDLPEVKYGESSEYVLLLEERLVRLGYLGVKADRRYRDETLNALHSFQENASLPKRSTVDASMWFELSKVPIA